MSNNTILFPLLPAGQVKPIAKPPAPSSNPGGGNSKPKIYFTNNNSDPVSVTHYHYNNNDLIIYNYNIPPNTSDHFIELNEYDNTEKDYIKNNSPLGSGFDLINIHIEWN
jgi:hypothetical protein